VEEEKGNSRWTKSCCCSALIHQRISLSSRDHFLFFFLLLLSAVCPSNIAACCAALRRVRVACAVHALSSCRPTRLALHFPFRPRRSGGGTSTTTIHLLSCLVQFTRDCISSSSPFSSFFFPLLLIFPS